MKSPKVRRRSRALGLALAALPFTAILAARPAHAAFTFYVSPDGAGTCCTKDMPCPLSYGATNAMAGDTVLLMDGTYMGQQLTPANSGTASAWITFQADDGAVPILDGGGGDVKLTGVGSDTSTYVRFIGLVSRNWASGFSNQWTGSTTDFTANGNWQYVNCIGDGNTRNGFAFNSTKGVLIQENISAHNGTSTASSWSSGFQLYAVQGTATDNVVQRNVSFENMDAQKHTDGSGFIVDTMVTGVSFINNLAFLNGGSGIRLTKSANITIINNTFYHNGRDTTDDGPPNPGEIYFTDGSMTQGLTMINNVGVASGTKADPTSAWVFNGGTVSIASSNKTSGTFADPDGTNPDFRLMSGNALVDKGDASEAPTVDIGFDPKCIKKGVPTDIAVPSWTVYSVDYTYIKSLGGVAGCWHPGTRPAGSGIDIGAYEYNSTPAPGTGGSSGSTASSTMCFAIGSGGDSGAAGASGSGGDSTGGSGGANGSASGGGTGSGSGGAASGGASGGTTGSASGGTTGGASGGTTGSASGGSSAVSTGGKTGSGGTSNSGGNSSNGSASGGSSGNSSGGSNGSGEQGSKGGGCSYDASPAAGGGAFLATVLFGLIAARLRRRHRAG